MANANGTYDKNQSTASPEPSADKAEAPAMFPAQAPVQTPSPFPAQTPSPFPAQTPSPFPAQAPSPFPAQAPSPFPVQAPTQPYVITCGDKYFSDGTFARDVANFRSCQSYVTGYRNLDAIQPFYPGFYCLGAISSIGKTTYVSQLAEQVAASGRWVIYFSLEQNAFEIVSKSLARGFRRTSIAMAASQNRPVDSYFAPSSIEIRMGMGSTRQAWLDQQIANYAKHVGCRFRIVHGAFSMTVENIINVTKEITAEIRRIPGVSPDENPVVFIDYLQIVAPTKLNGRIPDTKTSIDHIVHRLKAMQDEENMTVFVISSLNRMNYLTPVSFEAFKESGMVEYTVDNLFALELAIVNQDSFHTVIDKDKKRHGPTSMKDKNDMINAAKHANPRQIDLVCLKNRNGSPTFRLSFEYWPQHDYFRHAYLPGSPNAFTPDIVPTCNYQ